MMNFKNKTMILVGILGFLLAGCGSGSGDAGVPTSSNSVTETVGLSGGELELPDGSTVTIPPDAFSENVSVTFESKTGSTVPFNESVVEVLGKTLRLTFSPSNTGSSSAVKKTTEKVELKLRDDSFELMFYFASGVDTGSTNLSCRTDYFINEQGPTRSVYSRVVRREIGSVGFGLVCGAPIPVGTATIEVNLLSYGRYITQKISLEPALVLRFSDNALRTGCSPQDQGPKIPLILIHGWDDNIESATDLILENPQNGWDNFVNFQTKSPQCLNSDYEIFRFKYDSSNRIRSNGLLLKDKIDEDPRLMNRTDIVIIGHSMGGLVARSYIVEHGGSSKVHKLITLATPHHGSLGPSGVSWAASVFKILDTDGAKDLAWDNYDGVFKHGDRRAAGVAHPLIIFGKGCSKVDPEKSSCADYLQKLNEKDSFLDKYVYYGSAVFTNITFHSSLNKHENDDSYKFVAESLDDGLIVGSPIGHKIRGYFIDGAVPLESALHICPNLSCQTTVVPTTAGEALGNINAVLTPSNHRFIQDYDHTQMWQGVTGSDELFGKIKDDLDEIAQEIFLLSLLAKPTLTITKNGTGTGTVTISPIGGIGGRCSGDCNFFEPGTLVTLTAREDSGSIFTQWTGCTSFSGKTCNVTMNADKVINVTFNATSTNTPPTTNITSPVNATFNQGDVVTFSGTGNDVEDGVLSGGALVWTSSIDGLIGTGTSFTTSGLSVGTHTISLTATDSQGAIGSTSTSITVGSITVPAPFRLAAGYFHTCALLSDATIRCWGSNFSGELGDGTMADSHTPVVVFGITTAVRLATGSANHTCALLSDGTVSCWGWNFRGQLGNGTTVNSSTPVAVSGITMAVGLAMGYGHSCAFLSDGTVSCWGSNFRGQLGNGMTADSTTPVAVFGITTAVGVTAGDTHTCALLSDGNVLCWGSNFRGQLGNGTTVESPTPVAVSGITTAVGLAAGGVHTCALLSDSTIRCWGSNMDGQLGNGTTVESPTPVAVSGITTAVGLAAGDNHTCAFLSDSTIRCWGSNVDGQLGNGTTVESPTPVAVSGITTAVGLAAEGTHTCALLADRTIRCWGENSNGQLGDGTTVDSTTPVPVIGIPSTVCGDNFCELGETLLNCPSDCFRIGEF